MNEQYTLFKEMVNQVEKPNYIHCQNSAGSLLMDGQFCNAIRLESLFMDTILQNMLKIKVHLRPSAVSIKTVQVKTLKAGETVSYGRTYIADEEMTIAILPIGYADGYLRSMQGAFVNVNGSQCEVIGRICMTN